MKFYRLLLLVLITVLLSGSALPVQAAGTGVVTCVGLPGPLSHVVVIEWNWNRPRNPVRSTKYIYEPALLFAIEHLSGRPIWIGGTAQTWERPPVEMFHLSTYELHLIPAGYGDSDSDHYAVVKIFDNDQNWSESYVLAFPTGTGEHPCFDAGVNKGGLYWILSQAK